MQNFIKVFWPPPEILIKLKNNLLKYFLVCKRVFPNSHFGGIAPLSGTSLDDFVPGTGPGHPPTRPSPPITPSQNPATHQPKTRPPTGPRGPHKSLAGRRKTPGQGPPAGSQRRRTQPRNGPAGSLHEPDRAQTQPTSFPTAHRAQLPNGLKPSHLQAPRGHTRSSRGPHKRPARPTQRPAWPKQEARAAHTKIRKGPHRSPERPT